MSNAQPFYLTQSGEGDTPGGTLKPDKNEATLPSRKLAAPEESAELPERLQVQDEEAEDADGMHVRLTAEEPTIPAGRLGNTSEVQPGDDVKLPGQYIREERPMPRLH